MHIGIAVGEVLGAVALGLIVAEHTAGGIQAARLLVAAIHQVPFAQATLVGIAHAAIHAGAFVAAGQLDALGVGAAGIVRAAAVQGLAGGGWIAKEVRRAGALGLAIDDPALRIRAAGAVLEARIPAFALIAAFARLTVAVLAALELDALLAGLALVAVGAVAQHAMLRHRAQGIPATGAIIGTGIHALAILAALVDSTVSIRFAARNAGAALAQLTQRTLALGSALIAALAPRALLSALAVLGAAALGGTVGAAFVALAARMTAHRRQLAAREAVAHVGGRTLALHAVIDHQAVGTLATLAGRLAGILAFLVDAGLVVGAAEVVAAARLAYAILANLALGTGAVRVADGAAGAAHAALIRQAVLVVAALALAAARIAELVRAAVLVASAGDAWSLAGHVGIAAETRGAAALLAMIDGLAEGVGAAGSWLRAGIHALLSNAGQVAGTALVGAAARDAVEAQTHLSVGTLVVVAAERLADALLAALVGQAAGVVGTQWTTDGLEAGQAIAAVAILVALQRRRSDAADLGRGIRHHVVQATAAGAMIGHGAGSIGSTGTLKTGIDALIVAAGLGSAAIIIHVTSKNAFVVQAHMAQEAVVVNAAGHCIKMIVIKNGYLCDWALFYKKSN